MMFAEVYVPKGTLSREDRGRLAERLTRKCLFDSAAGDPGVLEFMGTITHVLVHEVEVWVAGRDQPGVTSPPRYVVRVHVPGPWRAAMSEHLVPVITDVLAEFDADSGRLYDQPHAEVHVLGVPEGGYGAYGRVVRESDLTELISKSIQGTADVPEGMAVDPVCGAVVPLVGSEAVTAEAGDTTYGFCCTGCRGHFLARQGAA